MNRRKILSYMDSTILAVCLALFLTCIGLHIGLGNKQIFQSTVAASSYYKKMAVELEDKLKVLLDEYDLPASLADELWPETNLYRDVNLYTKKVIEGTMALEDTPQCIIDLRDELKQRLSKWQANDCAYNDADWERIEGEILAIMEEDYATGIQLPILKTYNAFCATVSQFDIWVFWIAGSLILIMSIALFFMYRHKYRSVKYIMYGVVSGSMVSLLLNTIIGQSLHVEDAYITDQAYAALCNDVVRAGFEQANAGAMTGLLFGVILIGIYLYMREQNW